MRTPRNDESRHSGWSGGVSCSAMRAAALVLLLALGACGGEGDAEANEPETTIVTGTLTLLAPDGFDSWDRKVGTTCVGRGGYSDLGGSAQVVVRDARGKQVGLGELVDGTIQKGDYYPVCEFTFIVPDVPEGDGLYTVEVAKRGEVTFKLTDDKPVALTLGP